jgi:Flp pilus assembly protein TadG
MSFMHGRGVPTIVFCERGNVLIEFALILPILALMLIGLIDLGRYGLQKASIAEGARQGVQYGVMAYSGATASDSTQSAYINATAQNSTGLTGVTATNNLFCECVAGTAVSCTTTCGTGTLKRYITVSTSKPFTSILASGTINFGTFGSWTAPTSLSASVTSIVP